MKARVKATGHIVDVELSHYIDTAWYITKCHAVYSENELEFIDVPEDYWTRLEHQYAGMAMQGILSNEDISLDFESGNSNACIEAVAIVSVRVANKLVKKLKESK